MFIDPHVHCRDFEEAYKETIEHALYVAEKAGFSAIFDMAANGNPAAIGEEQVAARIQRAKEAKSPVFYGLYELITKDPKQIRGAVKTYRKYTEIVGLKLFAGHSVRDLGVTPLEDQFSIYSTLADIGYDGVLAAHCEKESLIRKRMESGKLVQDWDPKYPITHAFARPPEAEVESVRDQIRLAQETKFPGTLHIAHISVPEAVDLVDAARSYMKITCGVTPHHVLFDVSRMEQDYGVLYKMNPPLRPRKMKEKMFEYLKQGKIDWIETDHAPHTLKEKTCDPYMSGIPLLQYYPYFISNLSHRGFTEQQIEDLTFNNAKRTFSKSIGNLEKRDSSVSYILMNEYPMTISYSD